MTTNDTKEYMQACDFVYKQYRKHTDDMHASQVSYLVSFGGLDGDFNEAEKMVTLWERRNKHITPGQARTADKSRRLLKKPEQQLMARLDAIRAALTAASKGPPPDAEIVECTFGGKTYRGYWRNVKGHNICIPEDASGSHFAYHYFQELNKTKGHGSYKPITPGKDDAGEYTDVDGEKVWVPEGRSKRHIRSRHRSWRKANPSVEKAKPKRKDQKAIDTMLKELDGYSTYPALKNTVKSQLAESAPELAKLWEDNEFDFMRRAAILAKTAGAYNDTKYGARQVGKNTKLDKAIIKWITDLKEEHDPPKQMSMTDRMNTIFTQEQMKIFGTWDNAMETYRNSEGAIHRDPAIYTDMPSDKEERKPDLNTSRWDGGMTMAEETAMNKQRGYIDPLHMDVYQQVAEYADAWRRTKYAYKGMTDEQLLYALEVGQFTQAGQFQEDDNKNREPGPAAVTALQHITHDYGQYILMIPKDMVPIKNVTDALYDPKFKAPEVAHNTILAEARIPAGTKIDFSKVSLMVKRESRYGNVSGERQKAFVKKHGHLFKEVLYDE